MRQSQQPASYFAKVVIIGDSGVGKTNILLRLCQGTFKNNYVATIGVDFKTKEITVGDAVIRLQIWDTAGQ
jgi:Ras-related protein Rab-8A